MQHCVEVSGLVYWGELHKFMVNAPGATATAAAAGYAILSSALWTGSQVAGALGYKAAVAVLTPLGTLLAWLGLLCASHTVQILAAILLFVAWQIYFPSRLLIRLLAKLPYCRGVNFEFPPAPDKPSGKYVALTIDDGPCPYNTSAVLDTLKDSGAKATFFVVGSQVEKCDVIGVGSGRNGGEGHSPLGQETLRRMYTEGHELGNHTWHDRPSHTLTPKQLSKEITDVHRIIHNARQAAVTAAFNSGDSNDDSDAHSISSAPAVTGPRTKWFRPAWGWFTPEVVETAQKLGYHTVLGSVWPWDVYCKWPLINALYVATKVYPGAVVVLHDRRRHLLPTLKYVLPWLSRMGYDVVTLSEAAYRSNGRGPELTPAALEAHNKNHSSMSLASMNSARSLDSVPYIQPSAAYLARMAKEHERAAMIAAMEEAERAHLKAHKRAEADRRAGIDRRLVDMSAADKRKIERKEREKKEAEVRRARRKVEEAKARVRYERYVKERAERHAREAVERAEAQRKAKEAEERKRIATEEYNKRKEAEKKYAAEMVARQKAEREAREAEEAAAAAAAAAAADAAGVSAFSTASQTDASIADSSVGVDAAGDKKKRSGLGLLKKMGSKAVQKLGGKDKQSGSKGTAAVAAAAAATAVGVAGAAALSSGMGSASATGGFEPVAAETQLPDETYGWYGLPASADNLAALAKIDAAVAAYAATTELPEPVKGSYARGPGGRILLGFDGEPLLLSRASDDDADSDEAVLLNSRGEPLTGPNGEKVVMLLGANSLPLADPHGRPVFVAEAGGPEGRLLGVHPDGSLIMVPASSSSSQGTATATASAASAGSAKSGEHGSAAASRRVSSSSASGDVAAAMSAVHLANTSNNSDGSGSIKEASSYAPSLARTSVRSNISASAAGLPPRAPTPPLPPAAAAAAAHSTHTEAAPAPSAPSATASSAAGSDAMVPAQLLLGPSGRPLLGLDNRPLIVAVDEEGVRLVEGPDGELLLGPDHKPLQLAFASDGTMVALDSLCRPLMGADGCSHMVALDRYGRPMADESGHAIMLSLNPAGYVVAEAADSADHQRVSWPGSPSGGPRMSHSGNAVALLAASGAGATAATAPAGYEVALPGQANSSMAVVDAADYGAYSYSAAPAPAPTASSSATAATAVAAVGAAGLGAAVAAAVVSGRSGTEATSPTDAEAETAAAEEEADIAYSPAAGPDVAAGSLCDLDDVADRDSSLLCDQSTPSAAAAAAAAAAGPTSPTAWMAEQDVPAAADAEPTGLDLFTSQQQAQQQEEEQKQEEEEAQQQLQQLEDVEQHTKVETPLVQDSTVDQWQGFSRDEVQEVTDSEANAEQVSTPSAAHTGSALPAAAAIAGGATAAAAGAAGAEPSEEDSQSDVSTTPRSPAPASEETGSDGYTPFAPHLQHVPEDKQKQKQDEDLEVLKPGKITLSAQGVQLTATANGNY